MSVSGPSYRPPGAKRWSELFEPFFAEIFAKYPSAAEYDPCPCGLTLAIIPRRHVDPVLHFEVPDVDIRDRAMVFLKNNHRPEFQHEGDDAVLVLAEIA